MMVREKLAFVVDRYGVEVSGGAELQCRQLAERMSAVFDVDVYTTCALNYVTWENHYPAGWETINGVHVCRFPTERTRSAYEAPNVQAVNESEQIEWLEEQGPMCRALVRQVVQEHSRYKAVIFMTYLYYPTAMCLTSGLDNGFLIPTIHDEPVVYLPYYDKVFAGAKGIIWNTPVEREFAEKRFPFLKNTPGVYAGVGVDVPAGELPEIPDALKDAPYIVYAGRIDMEKGCGEMFDHFRRYKRERGGDLKLVLMGKAVMDVPKADDIVDMGFVTDEMKFSVMRSARALVLFSKFESLSMVVLESMTMGRPVLVNGECAVLKEHCIRSNAGLYFESYPEFAATLDWMLSHEAEYKVMCENGVRYVQENYQWDKIVGRISDLIQ